MDAPTLLYIDDRPQLLEPRKAALESQGYWESVNEFIQREPVVECDRFFMAMLKPLGIEKGKPFQPDARQTKILTDGATVGGARRKYMKTSTKDKIKGSFHEVTGTIKEEVGKVTNDRNLKAEGKAEKKAGKVQQRIGHAKEDVAKLKGQLTELKAG